MDEDILVCELSIDNTDVEVYQSDDTSEYYVSYDDLQASGVYEYIQDALYAAYMVAYNKGEFYED